MPMEPGARENQHPPSRSCRQLLNLEVKLQELIMPSSAAGARRVCGFHGKPALLASSAPGPGTLSAPSTAGAPGRRMAIHLYWVLPLAPGSGAGLFPLPWGLWGLHPAVPMGTPIMALDGGTEARDARKWGDGPSPDAALRALV